MRVAPGPVLSGDRQLGLDAFVVPANVVVPDRPVRSDPVQGVGLEVTGMEPRTVAGVVNHGAAHAAARVVLAQLDWVFSADDALLRPIQGMGAGLVGDPVLAGMPERAGFEYHDPPAGARQPLREHRAAGARPDDQQVHRVVVAVAPHRLFTGEVAGMHVEQEAGIVVLRPDRALEDATQEVAHHNSPLCTIPTGSSSVAPRVSNGSRTAAGPVGPPRRMNPRG